MPLEIVKAWHREDGRARLIEKHAHLGLAKLGTIGEWFRATPEQAISVVEQAVSEVEGRDEFARRMGFTCLRDPALSNFRVALEHIVATGVDATPNDILKLFRLVGMKDPIVRRDQTEAARRVAVRVLRGRRPKATEEKMRRARELWPLLGEWSVAQISKEVGLSTTLLYKRLGGRETYMARMEKKHV